MSKSAFTPAHRHLVATLVAARQNAGLLQADLAAKLGKDQSYVSNIERGQRRVDVIEFYAIARALGLDAVALYARVVENLDHDIEV